MKQGKSMITFAMAAIAVALVIYFGFYVFDTLNDPFTTTLAYSYTANDSVEADGVLVREEQVFFSQAGIVDVTRSEGEKVGVGQTVALVYRDSQAQADQAEMEALVQEIELLEYAITDSGSVESAARLDEDIIQSVVALRSAAALGDYAQLEDQVMSVKSNVLKRGYTYGDGMTPGDITQRLQTLKTQYTALSRQNASATTRVTASQSGVFSNLVDGYETVLTPETVFQLTPSTVKAMLAEGGTVSGGIGKLITSNRWYFAALLPAETADRLQKGETVTMRFTGDFTQDVDMQVDQIGAAEGNEILVVFSSDRYLTQTTLLRQQTAELIFESWTGLRAPKEAVHMIKDTAEDPETGETVETGNHLGVYVLIGGRAELKTVEVVTEGNDYYVVRATTTDSAALRAGDKVIVRAVGLYDGQLLEF